MSDNNNYDNHEPYEADSADINELADEVYGMNDEPSKPDRSQFVITVVLDEALKTRNFPLLKQMLEAGLPVDHRRKGGRTALMFAAYRNDVEMTKFLLGHGANPSLVDEERESPISLCFRHQSEVTDLIAYEILSHHINYSSRTMSNWTIRFSIFPEGGKPSEAHEKKTLLDWVIKFDFFDLFEGLLSRNLDLGWSEIDFEIQRKAIWEFYSALKQRPPKKQATRDQLTHASNNCNDDADIWSPPSMIIENAKHHKKSFEDLDDDIPF